MKLNSVINESQIRDKWCPIIEDAIGTTNQNQNVMDWLPIYAHNHAISESSYATLGNTPGMGAVSLPTVAQSQFGFQTAANGSGDKPVSYLAMSMQIAADTVGFNCVPVVPADSPLTILTYADFIYADGKIDSKTNVPSIFKVDATVPAAMVPGSIVTFTDPASPGVGSMVTVYLGKSRLQGFPILLVKSIPANQSITDMLTLDNTGSFATGSATGTLTVNDVNAQNVRALEDHIAGFSGVLFSKLLAAATPADSVTAMLYAVQPYNRADGESTNTRSMGLKFYNKAVEAETWQVDIATTREQVDDARQFGFDVHGKAQKVLVNEATQSINKNILEKIFELGAKNHLQVFNSTGNHFNVNFDYASGVGSTDFVLGWDNAGNLTTISTPTPIAKVGTGGETLMTAQRRILDMLLAAANEIGIRGRREPGDTIVANSQVGTVLQSIQGFQAAPTSNTIKPTAGLRMLGTLSGMNIFIDPNMPSNDTRVAVFRKGDGETPGLIYMPYRIADIVSTIAENTMSPKYQLKSRGKLVEAGHTPHVYYITLRINTQFGLLR